MKYGILQEPGFQEDGIYIPNEYYMDLAIQLGEEALADGQHPVGAVVTCEFTATRPGGEPGASEKVTVQRIAGYGANRTNLSSERHAEVKAIQNAEMHYGRYNLGQANSVLYTTHEPCPMCAGLVTHSKLKGVVFGTSAADAETLAEEEGIPWRSNQVSGLDIIQGRIEANKPAQFVIANFMRDECLDLLRKSVQLLEQK